MVLFFAARDGCALPHHAAGLQRVHARRVPGDGLLNFWPGSRSCGLVCVAHRRRPRQRHAAHEAREQGHPDGLRGHLRHVLHDPLSPAPRYEAPRQLPPGAAPGSLPRDHQLRLVRALAGRGALRAALPALPRGRGRGREHALAAAGGARVGLQLVVGLPAAGPEDGGGGREALSPFREQRQSGRLRAHIAGVDVDRPPV
mmetsp:Transcript_72026/g.204442  ORF Transcript_72026/g.204442 Transcript_72026/m.204442 type:complete len:200 (-) Transcript_72026:1008-1607(-)